MSANDRNREDARRPNGEFGPRLAAEATVGPGGIDLSAPSKINLSLSTEEYHRLTDPACDAADLAELRLRTLGGEYDFDFAEQRINEAVEQIVDRLDETNDPVKYASDLRSLAARCPTMQWETPGYGSDWGTGQQRVEGRIEATFSDLATALRAAADAAAPERSTPVSHLRIGQRIRLDAEDPAVYTITSIDNDHKTTSFELDGDEDSIAEYDNAEKVLLILDEEE